MRRLHRHVGFVPKPDSRIAANSVFIQFLIGELLNMQRHFEAERLRNLEVDHQLELSRLHDRQIGRLGAAQRATGSMPPVNVP